MLFVLFFLLTWDRMIASGKVDKNVTITATGQAFMITVKIESCNNPVRIEGIFFLFLTPPPRDEDDESLQINLQYYLRIFMHSWKR